jgi:hypothetical protein
MEKTKLPDSFFNANFCKILEIFGGLRPRTIKDVIKH